MIGTGAGFVLKLHAVCSVIYLNRNFMKCNIKYEFFRPHFKFKLRSSSLKIQLEGYLLRFCSGTAPLL